MRVITVKEGPLVFLRNVIVMEFVAATLLYALSFLLNYEQLFGNWGLIHYIHYNQLLVLFFSGFQIVYVSALFLDWYFSHYEINDREIIRLSGLLFRHRKSVSLRDVASVEIYQSPLSRMMHHATIILEHSNGRRTKLKNVSNYEEYVHIVKQMAQGASGRILSRDVKTLISHGEGNFVEFKESLRYDTRKGEVSKEMERMVIKAIVGFMNADGGTLIIGVNDSGTIVGLENDYKVLPKKNRDGLENHIVMLVKTMIGLTFAKYVSVEFEKVADADVCLVIVRESHKPAYLRNGDKHEEFFVRVGNSTQPFSMSEAEEYIKTHWK